MAGASSQGFVKKTFDEIKTDLETRARLPEYFGEDVDVSAYSPIGKLIAIFSSAIAENWQGIESNYFAAYIDSATGNDLDRLGRLIGIPRKPALPETTNLIFTGTDYAVIPKDFYIQTAAGILYKTVESKSIQSGTATVQAQAELTGTLYRVAAGQLTEFVTPAAGLDTVTNDAESTGGALRENDADYRARILDSTGFIKNSGAVPYMKTKMEESEFVSSIYIEENSLAVEQNGLPANSLAFTVQGGTDSEVAELIYQYKPAGVLTVGDISVAVSTGFGDTQTMNFSRPTNLDIYAALIVESGAGWIADNERLLRTAIVEYVGGVDTYTSGSDTIINEYTGLGIGENVIAFKAFSFIKDIPGIENLSILFGTTTGDRTYTSIDTASNEIPNIVTANISLVVN